MKPALRVMLCDDAGERFFGEGPCRLLHLIEETGSLRSAAAQMGLSYSKALRLVQHAEKELGFALTCKTIGGRGGGGSTLTAEVVIYPQLLKNVRVANKAAAKANPAVQKAVEDVAEALGDDGRILVRESGTEPVIRVMVEAPDDATCAKYVDQVVSVMHKEGLVTE